jgi:hypothetical protein
LAVVAAAEIDAIFAHSHGCASVQFVIPTVFSPGRRLYCLTWAMRTISGQSGQFHSAGKDLGVPRAREDNERAELCVLLVCACLFAPCLGPSGASAPDPGSRNPGPGPPLAPLASSDLSCHDCRKLASVWGLFEDIELSISGAEESLRLVNEGGQF